MALKEMHRREMRAVTRASLPNRADLFAAINLIVFLLMAALVYWDRFQSYRGPANVEEFLAYATVIAGVILILWRVLRNVDFPVRLLLLVQIGILAHFAGGFVPVVEGRLYDAEWAGIHYDKLVHGYNAFAGAALIGHVLGTRGARLPAFGLIVIGLVLGIGALVEIVEYLVLLTVPDAAVGTYDNNMQDMIANATGAALMVMLAALRKRFRRPARLAARWPGLAALAGLGLLFAFGLWWVGPRVPTDVGYRLLFWLLVATAAVTILALPPGLRGFAWRDGRGSWRVAAPSYAAFTAAAAVSILLALLVFKPDRFGEVDWEAVAVKFVGYLLFGFIQAVIFFSFLLTQLRRLIGGPHRQLQVTAAVAVIFSIVHLPNFPLVGLTLLGGFGWAMIFYRRPNVWLLTLSHALIGTLLHQVAGLYMRIGPFYHDPSLFILRTVIPGLDEFIGGRF